MRYAWIVLVLAACTEQEKGQIGIDNGITLGSAPVDPLAVGASAALTFSDQCIPDGDTFCHYDSVRSVGSTTVNGPFEVVSTSPTNIIVKATGEGTGRLHTTITQSDGEVKTFDRDLRALAANRAEMYCFGFQGATTPQVVLAGAGLSDRSGGGISVLFANLFSGSQVLFSDSIFPFTGPGLAISGTTVKAPTTPGLVTLTTPLDPTFSFSIDVVDLAQIDNLELVKVPQSSNVYVGFQIKPTVGGREMCRAPWEAMTMTAGPAGICSLSETIKPPGKLPTVQLHGAGTCHVEARITGTTLIASTDISL